jgi:hypothetical protein
LPEFRSVVPSEQLTRFFDYDAALKTVVVPEENLLADPSVALIGGSQVVRGFARAFYRVTAFRQVDPNWNNRGRNFQQYELRVRRLDAEFGKRVASAYESASRRGKWKGTSAIQNAESYFVTGVMAYFDAVCQDAAPIDAEHPISTREELREYDSGLYDLVHETMAYGGHVDWRLGK